MSHTPLHVHSVFSTDKVLLVHGCIPFSKTDLFIQKHKAKSNFKWKYCYIEFIKYNSMISLTCPIHGLQKPKTAEYLLKGNGCKKCAVSTLKLKSTELKIQEFSLLHKNKYDYTKIKSRKILSTDKINITCPIHGDFEQRVSAHMDGQGCPLCSSDKKTISVEEFYSRVLSISDSILFEFSDFKNMTTDMSFTCSKHGSFIGKPYNLLNNELFCPKCGSEIAAEKLRKPTSHYVEQANIVHGNKYDYSKFHLGNSKEKGIVICPIHGEFYTSWNYHVHGKNGCPKCGGQLSKEEDYILRFIGSLCDVEILNRCKPDWLNGKELDIYISKLNMAIEYNGSYWHSEKYRDKEYHFRKWEKCYQNGIKLLNIWEHYWRIPVKRRIYLYKIIHLLGLDEKIHARKCVIRIIERTLYDKFILENHLEGTVLPYKDMEYIGLYYGSTLVMVAGYGLFWSQSEKFFKWKLQRICTLLGITVSGGVSKLTKYIKNKVGDFQFQITLDTGGSLLKTSGPISPTMRYWWVNSKMEYKTRNECQVQKLKLNSDWIKNDSEVSYMERNKWFRVWDTGVVNL